MAEGILQQAAGFFGFTDVTGIDLIGSALATAWFWIKVFLSVALTIAVFMLVYQLFIRNNIRVTVLRRIGSDSFNVLHDTARIEELALDGGRRIILARTRFAGRTVSGKLPDSEFKNKKGARDHYTFLLDENGLLHPMKPFLEGSQENGHIKLFSEDMRWWARREDKRRLERYQQQSKLQIYLPSIIMICALGGAVLMSYFAFQYLGGGIQALATSFGQVASSCLQLQG